MQLILANGLEPTILIGEIGLSKKQIIVFWSVFSEIGLKWQHLDLETNKKFDALFVNVS